MLQHPSARMPAVESVDPGLQFPRMSIGIEFTVGDSWSGTMRVDTKAAIWRLDGEVGLAHSGLLGEKFVDSRVTAQTWPLESPATLEQAAGTSDPRQLLRYLESIVGDTPPRLEYLERLRSAISGEGPFPIQFYMPAPDGSRIDGIPEEHDILARFELHAHSPVLAHVQFANSAGSALVVLDDGRVYGKAIELWADRDWQSLKFPSAGGVPNSLLRRNMAA